MDAEVTMAVTLKFLFSGHCGGHESKFTHKQTPECVDGGGGDGSKVKWNPKCC